MCVVLRYLELLLRARRVLRREELQDPRDQVSVGEAEGPQSRRQHVLSPAAHLKHTFTRSTCGFSNILFLFIIIISLRETASCDRKQQLL